MGKYTKWILVFMLVAVLHECFVNAASSSESKESKESKEDLKGKDSSSSEEEHNQTVDPRPGQPDGSTPNNVKAENFEGRVRRAARRPGGKFRPSPLLYG